MGRHRFLVILAILSQYTGTAYTQSLTADYRYALGVRAGGTSGFTFKLDTRNAGSVELLAGFWSRWFSITGLYEKNGPAFQVEGMTWYYGGGGHIAFETRDYYRKGRYYERGDDFALGIDGIIGLEYKIPPIPLAVSMDFKPFLEIDTNGDVYFGPDPGIGVKFTF